MDKLFRKTWLFLIPFIAASVAGASRVMAQGAEEAGSHLEAVLSWQGVLATVIYGLIGMMLALFGYKLYDWITPFSLTKELEEDQNVSVGIVVGSFILGASIIVAAAIVG